MSTTAALLRLVLEDRAPISRQQFLEWGIPASTLGDAVRELEAEGVLERHQPPGETQVRLELADEEEESGAASAADRVPYALTD